MGMILYVAGMILSPLFLLASFGLLAYGFYQLSQGEWVAATAFLLAALVCWQMGSFLYTRTWDEDGELRG